MKLSDYVADFLARQGIRHVFIVSGGASIHLLHSIAEHPDIEHICPHHEQAGAFAADAYARVTGMGCAIGTSGPGATNLITGIAGCWYDSVPCLFITGQVASFRSSAGTGVRQMGFQETPIVDMVRPITKAAIQIRHPQEIMAALNYAVLLAKQGRSGPVLVDIPDDFQRADVDPDKPILVKEWRLSADSLSLPAINHAALLPLIQSAERPVLILGNGARLYGPLYDMVYGLGFPVLTSWGMKDYLPDDHMFNAGTFGTHGTRAGNFAVQNADLVLAVGARLSTRETGDPATFARGAKLVVVDIDAAEVNKLPRYGRPVDLAIQADAAQFAYALLPHLPATSYLELYGPWFERIDAWKAAYPPPDTFPYRFIAALSEAMPEDEHVFIDTGCAVAWMMQAFRVKKQRLFHDFNNTAMGWALPAAIGGCLALGRKPVTCVVGDGSLMMNLQELATIRHHNLPIRIIVLNNGGYGMVRQTEEQWLGGRHVGTDKGDLWFPDFLGVGKMFDIPSYVMGKARYDHAGILRGWFDKNGPCLLEIWIEKEDSRVEPQAKFGYPIEDSEPLLPREEFLRQMIVEPLEVSKHG